MNWCNERRKSVLIVQQKEIANAEDNTAIFVLCTVIITPLVYMPFLPTAKFRVTSEQLRKSTILQVKIKISEQKKGSDD